MTWVTHTPSNLLMAGLATSSLTTTTVHNVTPGQDNPYCNANSDDHNHVFSNSGDEGIHLISSTRAQAWRIPFEPPRFDEDREVARLACLDTIGDLSLMLDLNSSDPTLLEALDIFYAYLSRPIKNRKELDQAITLTTSIMDILLLDEMAADDRDWCFRTPYGRQDGIVFDNFTRLILPRGEANAVFESMGQKSRRHIDSIHDIADYPKDNFFYLGHELHSSAIADAYRSIQDIAAARNAPLDIVLGANYGSAVMFIRYNYSPPDPNSSHPKANVNTISTSNLLSPCSSMPRQDFWSSLLSQGTPLSIMGDRQDYMVDDVQHTVEDILKLMQRALFRHPDESDKRHRLKRLAALVRNAHNPARLELFESNHVRHYRKLLAIDGVEPHVFLTRSGVSANEIAIEAVANMTEKWTKAHVHPGWYYENKASIEQKFMVYNRVENTTCCFVNLLPCFPETFMRGDVGTGSKLTPYLTPMETIGKFLDKAGRHEDTPHYLVIDKTSDLLFALPNSDIPPNVTVIETASLSKHQRGARNYFFGIISSGNGSKVERALETAKAKTTSGLTPFGIVNLPRLTKSEIRDRRAHFQSLHRSFAEGFNKAQESLPVAFRSRAEVQDNFVYIIPPVELALRQIDEFVTSGNLPKPRIFTRSSGSTDYTQLRLPHRMSFGGLESAYEGPLKKIGIYLADSFGLEDTRTISICFDFKNRWVPSQNRPGENTTFSVQSLRISAGFAETIESIAQKGEKLGNYLVSDMKMYMTLNEFDSSLKRWTALQRLEKHRAAE